MNWSLYLLSALLSLVSAHYTFPALVYNGVRNGDWQHVRTTKDRFNKSPVVSVASTDIRCNEDPSRAIAQTLSVAAGSTIAFTSDTISHPGALLFYLAKVPSGRTAANWDGSGPVWFKIYEENVSVGPNNQLVFSSLGVRQPSVTLPAALPNGEYLLRVEHIALHTAGSTGGAQFYLACGQISVTNGGNGRPGPLVAFPGAYSATDPGIRYNMYAYPPTAYKPPGPAVWRG